MLKMMVWFQQALWAVKNEKGAVAIEYGLFVALITVGIIVSVTGIGTKLAAAFAKVLAALPAA